MTDYGKTKIVMCSGGYLMPSYDEFGTYNLSDNMLYLLVNNVDEYIGLQTIINSKLITYLNKITMTDNLHGRDTVIKNIKYVDLQSIKTENDVYTIYQLTQNEIDLINKTI
jgi:hypothetical protein